MQFITANRVVGSVLILVFSTLLILALNPEATVTMQLNGTIVNLRVGIISFLCLSIAWIICNFDK